MGAPENENPQHNRFPCTDITHFLMCQQDSSSDIDSKLGLECFQSHRLPPGTQFEGIEKLVDDGLTIRIMNGVEVVTLDCWLNPDGTLRSTGK